MASMQETFVGGEFWSTRNIMEEKRYSFEKMTENMACGSGRACCPCNKKGYCRNCCCVKSGHFCMSCLPSKLGNCANLPVKQSPSPVPYPTYSASRARSPSPVPAQPSAVSPNHTSPASLLSSHNSVVDLPSFKTVSDPNFVWGVLSGNECISVINRCYSKYVKEFVL